VPLRITRVTLQDFRSYKSFVIEPDEKLTVVVGPNATGKTNIIEAIQLLTATSSFRNPAWAECVHWGAEQAFVALEAEGGGRKLETRLSLSTTGRRVYTVNGTTKRRLSDVAGLLPSVVFTPDDLRMVKDSAERRRAAIDGVGDQLSTAYLALRAEYEKIVRQRNALLKTADLDPGTLEVLTQRLVDRGTAFSAHRKRLFTRLSDRLEKVYFELVPQESLEARYESSWVKRGESENGDGSFEGALEKARGEETARGTTAVGPHRDEIVFLVNGRDARAYASQGQQRTIALAWKLAEISVIQDVGGQPPVLLLDDVMSELDEERRHALTSFVGEAAQTIVTTTNIGYFEQSMLDRAKLVRLQ